MDGLRPIETVAVSPGVEIGVFRAPREDGSHITAYSLTDDGDHLSPKAAIVLLHGSGSNSVFPRLNGHIHHPLLFGALCDVRDRWNVYFVEKRGVAFGQCEPEGGARNCSVEYLKGASYEGRVSDVCRVLDQLLADRAIAERPLVIIGSSEGSAVAVGVAAKSRAPTHIALLPFSGGHGPYDHLVGLRAELTQGAITPEEFREQYDWLVSTFRDILGPSRDSIEKTLWGHTYRRWSSYCSGTPLADLLTLEIPVFLGIPSLDRCEGADLAVAEFVRHDKTNLTYRNYVNYDHGFFEQIRGRTECRHSLVLADILQWVRHLIELVRPGPTPPAPLPTREGGVSCA